MKSMVLLFLALFALQGCATILNGSKKSLAVSSSEDKTKITVWYEGKKLTGRNFVQIKSKKGEIHAIGEKEGCVTTERIIDSKKDWGWYIAGNAVSWNILGWLVDPLTGGLWYYKNTEIDVTPVCSDDY